MISKIILKSILILLLTVLLLPSSSCKKSVSTNAVDKDNFLRVYQDIGDQNIYYVSPSTDGGLLMIGTQDLNLVNDQKGLFILRIDALGLLVWKKTIPNIELPYPVCSTLKDGSIIINANGNMLKLTPNGDIVFNTSYETNKNKAFGYPLEASDGTILAAYTSGWGQYTPADNFIVRLKPDGSVKKYFTISDANFGFKNLIFNIYKCVDSSSTYYLNGFCMPNFTGWNQDPKMYIAKFQYSGNNIVYKKTTITYSKNNDLFQGNWWNYYTSDNHLLFLVSSYERKGTYKMHLVKSNDSLDIVWEKDLRITANNCSPSGVNECPDGNYLVFGTCRVDDKLSDQPFVCKLDTNGNILWQKIYSTALNSIVGYSAETNGNIWVGGSTTGFGKGATKNDVFIMKTDLDGNLK